MQLVFISTIGSISYFFNQHFKAQNYKLIYTY
jgi:hypothetical protein